jgi:hypothetical protein
LSEGVATTIRVAGENFQLLHLLMAQVEQSWTSTSSIR